MADIIIWFGMACIYVTIAAIPVAIIHLWIVGQRHPMYAKPRRK